MFPIRVVIYWEYKEKGKVVFMKYIFSCLLLLSAMLLSGSVENDRVNGSALLATVNGEAVTLGQVVGESASGERLAKAYANEDKNSEIFKLRQAAVDRIIDRKLMIAEFKRLKLTLPTHYVESLMDDLAENMGCKTRSELAAKARAMNTTVAELREKASERLMAEMVIGREYYAAGTPTPEEMATYFQENEAQFSIPEKLKLALLLLPENSSPQNITELEAQLKKSPARFAELVRAFSCGPNREQGGEVGFIERKNIRKEFAGALAGAPLADGRIYGPVKTAEGIYFIRVCAIEAGKAAVFAEHRDAIRKKLEDQRREKSLNDLKKRLRSKAIIRYYFGHTPTEQPNSSGEVNINVKQPEKAIKEQPVKPMEKKTMVTLKTNHGDIKLELFADAAPKTVANFLEYVKSGFYNGTLFHRVIDNFMIQGGGFDTNFKQKKTREPIENEADNRLSNEVGTIAMARTMDPHSATAQFFINVNNNDFLDFRSPSPQFYGYCVFGKVVEGMDVVNKIKVVKTGGRAGHQDVPKEDVIILEAIAD